MRGAFAYHFVLQPFLAFAIGIAGVTLQPLPVLDAATLMIHRSASFAGTHTGDAGTIPQT